MIEKMQRYIEQTPSCKLESYYYMTLSQAAALSRQAKEEGPIEAIALAFSYGRAMGLRMGRKEAERA